MEPVAIVTIAALLQYMFMSMMVGRARGRYGVAAPAVSGNEIFERYYRVQANTLENLVIFIPALWLNAHFASETEAAAVGLLFVIGRALYMRSYISDPAKRGLGFIVTMAANVILLGGALVGAIGSWGWGAG